MNPDNTIDTVRDLNILEYISLRNYVVPGEISHFFPKASKKSRCHYRRMNQLKNRGYLEDFIGRGDKKIGYRLSQKGLLLLNEKKPSYSKNSFRTDFFREKYDHDIYLQEIENIILKSPIVDNFIPESGLARKLELNSNSENIVPDGYFHLNIDGKRERVVLELELHQKSKKRYKKIFMEHLLSDKWDSVFYITKDKKLKKKLSQYLEEITQDVMEVENPDSLNSFYFCPLKEFQEKKLDAQFYGEEISFSFKQLE